MDTFIRFSVLYILVFRDSIACASLLEFSDFNSIIDHLKKAEETVKIGKEPASAIIKRDGKGLSYLTRLNNLVGLPNNNYGILTVDGSVSQQGDIAAELTLDAYTLFGTPRIRSKFEIDSKGNLHYSSGVEMGGLSDDSLNGKVTIGGGQYLTNLDVTTGYGPGRLSLHVFQDIISWSGIVDMGVASLSVGVNGDGSLASLKGSVKGDAYQVEVFADMSASIAKIFVNAAVSLGAYGTAQLNLNEPFNPELVGTINWGALNLSVWSALLKGDYRIGGKYGSGGLEFSITSETFTY